MDLAAHRRNALVTARARAVLGLVMLVFPGLVARVTFGDAGRGPAMRLAFRLVGVRDLVLGVGAITTLKEQTMDAEWVGMGALADAVDGAAALVTPGLGLRSRLLAATGGGAAAVGFAAARAIADARPAESEVDSR